MPASKEYEFQADMQPLLHLLTHSLYTNEEIFLRELISNAADALNKLRFLALTQPDLLGKDEELKISLSLDEKTQRLSIEDNGIGMNQPDLIQNLGTVARSGTDKFLKQLKEQSTTDQQQTEKFIGQFGVGFYSVFIVADEVCVTTKKAGEQEAYCWRSNGNGKFTIEACEKEHRGTVISFQFKDSKKHLNQNWQIENIVKKYSNFVSFPIWFNAKSVTEGQAIWTRSQKQVKPEEYEEFFQFLSPQTPEKPLAWLPMQVEAPTQFRAILFIPPTLDPNFMDPNNMNPSLHLYVKRVFIQDDCKELLPSWLRFVQGVVDAEDLPLNISRQVTQQSPILSVVRKYLVRKLLALFADFAENDKPRFKTFWLQFSKLVKEGIYTDHEQRPKLVELLHCYSSHSKEELTNLKSYLSRMQAEQTNIYYALNTSQQAIESSPNFEYFQKQGWEVLYFDQEVDSFILPLIPDFEKKPLVSIDQAEIKPQTEEQPTAEKKAGLASAAQAKLLQYFKDLLKDEVSDVIESNRLVDSPCTLVDLQDAPSRQMEQLMKMMNKETTISKKILEINMHHPMIISLGQIQQQRPQDPVLQDCIMQLYQNTLLRDGSLPDPDTMILRSHRLLQQLVGMHVEALQSADEKTS